ncbi:hypothetical protein [Pseudomonas gregormendelii]
MNYVITSGWWCSNENTQDRTELIGDDAIRNQDFHRVWHQCIRETNSKANIYIVDSASPVKPLLNEGEKIISFEKNFGHSTRCDYKLSGVTRAHIMGMTLALLNEYEYWVYIEQDALIQGEQFIERCISSMNSPMAFGDGQGTPYPAQQSFMIIKTSYIETFLHRLLKIKASDKDIAPELKFCIASSKILSLIPEFIYKFIDRRGALNKAVRIIIYGAIKLLRGFDYIPFGHGRSRPIDFSHPHFYFQHGSAPELDIFLSQKNHSNETK